MIGAGQIEVTAMVTGFSYPQFNTFEIQPDDQSIAAARYELVPPSHSQPKPAIKLTILIQNVPTPADAFNLSVQYAKKAMSRMAFHFAIGLDDPIVGTLELEEAYDGKTSWIYAATVSMTIAAHQTYALVESDLLAMKQNLKDYSHSSDAKFELLRDATRCSDTTEQFMCLYALLYDWQGNSQQNVDIFIIANDPDPQPQPSAIRSSGSREPRDTIYTRLRNVIGHYRSGQSLEGTRQAMQQRLHGLILLARLTIDPLIGHPVVTSSP